MPKRLKENAAEDVENFMKIEVFDLEATLACRSTFMEVFQSISKDLLNINANFTLENLSCVKDFLALHAWEKEVKEEDLLSKSESSGVFPPHFLRARPR